MKADSATLQKIFYSPSWYVIPVFQRYYTWGPATWKRLWEDLNEISVSDQQNKHHFMGSLVFVPDKLVVGSMPSFQVIDGQQRLITLSLLLCALRDHAKASGWDALATQLTEDYLIHRFEKGDQRLRVSPRQRDRHSYQWIVLRAEHIPHMDQESIKLVDETVGSGNHYKAYHYFSQQIKAFPNSDEETAIQNFFTLVRNQLEFVHITLNEENPYQIFKSLNSTGVDLSEGDLIRNFMFMHVDLSRQDKFDDEQWKPIEKHFEFHVRKKGELDSKAFSGFFRDFLMRNGLYIGPDATYETFEKHYSEAQFSAVLLAQEIKQYASFYDVIRGVKPSSANDVTQSLAKLRALSVSTAYPLLLKMLHLVDNGSMSTIDLRKALELLSGFVFRRLVCGEQSRQYGRWFVSACKELKNNPLEDLRLFLKSKGFPNDARFKSAFVRFSLYRGTDAKFVLAALEHKHLSHIANEAADLSKVQVEHILPQTLTTAWQTELGQNAALIQEEWLHTPGNLTLTGYNQSLGNKSFSDKCNGWIDMQGKKVPGYKDSNIAITKEVSLQAVWTETEITDRAERLAHLAASVYVDSDF